MHLDFARSFVVPMGATRNGGHGVERTATTHRQQDEVGQARALGLCLPDGSQFRLDRPLQLG